jgi:hypothetical protein
MKTKRLEGKVYLLGRGSGIVGSMEGKAYNVVFLTESGKEIQWQPDIAEDTMDVVSTEQGSCYRIKANIRENGNVRRKVSLSPK